ncbi:cyclic pyranopterin monophosphate synthase MoaC [Solitalea canadensis]|uniref:cyclic pyranopterin monophosphate synthase n=1 Tax=Solitalea canadensis (strain ATCC 29591 / DSM 3403 / JCM 21819 / LMG 8368 / NBRC 15130 / NCIMB 12057 / USAM 9D) TaxID=929556 RepID=H8KU59_SOLCM|nr:cyclic pyranopterin monophosphate synthase MoaC [Solitalea canadensis]AFD07039.1 molybdenum cofactor biosynthesis protein MoaC [Solitalea canadensis DSM 3403]
MTTQTKDFTHLDENNQATIVDIESKKITTRIAVAQSRVFLPQDVLVNFVNGEIVSKKGAVFQSAIIAGIMAAKKTPDLIPLCHTLLLENCKITINVENDEAVINCTVKTTGKTGVEMEALTGASIAALTIYDMCKALSHDMIIRETKLMSKSGGKNDFERK